MKASLFPPLLVLLLISNVSFAIINTVSLSASTAMDCDTVIITISGTHVCPGDMVTGVTHTVSGPIITLNASVSTGICILNPPTPFSTTYTLPLTGISPGSYTVEAFYNSLLSSSTASLTITSCCPSKALARTDTTMCDTDSLKLYANAPPAGSTASWSVLAGSGVLSSTTNRNATISNLSYGVNEVVWTMVDALCTTKDTVIITNYEMPTLAVTEPNRISCEDTSTIKANPLTVGLGLWLPITPGVSLSNPNNPNTLATFSMPGSYRLEWYTNNGSCESSDSLIIDYVTLTDTPIISRTNLLLTSSPTPQYQWYLNNNPIPGATAMTYTALSNGTYKVLGSELGCMNGLFSNEIEIQFVGINEKPSRSNYILTPNPSNGWVRLVGSTGTVNVTLFSLDGKILQRTAISDGLAELDYSDIGPGLFIVQISSNETTVYKRLILTR